MNDISSKLQELNITLPNAAPPAANYVPYMINENLVYISGQLPILDGELAYKGKVGESISIAEATKAAELCVLNILSQLNQAVEGNLDKVKQCLKLGIFVNSVTDFKEHAIVGNGGSDILVKILGDAGKHARFAVGANSLPFDVPVEIDAIFKIS